MELVLAVTQLEVGAPLVLPNGTRPVDGTSGIDITSWRQGGWSFASFALYLLSDGADRTVAAPGGGGATGVEVWTYKKNKAGVSKWYLVGTLYGGAVVPVPAVNGFAAILTAPLGDRLAIAGTPSAIGAVSYFAEPIEHSIGGGLQ